MRTAPRTLANTHADLLIVGGGIHGLFAAYDAALRGLTVVLVERGDIAGALSFNHQRTIHGGLRDLGSGRLRKARRQMFERRRWVQMAPRLVRPLPFVMGTTRALTRSRLALGLGLVAFEALGKASAQGVPASLRLPRPSIESVASLLEACPGLTGAGLTGAARWFDYQTPDPDRLNGLVALAAVQAGARLCTYAEVTGALLENGRVAGASVTDRVTGDRTDVTADITLLAAGGDLGPVAALFGAGGAPPLVRAMNLVLERAAPPVAVAAPSPTGRMLTIVPWGGYALVGTSQSAEAIAPGEARPPRAAVDEMLAEVNATFPHLAVQPADVRVVHHGLAPAELRGGRLDLKVEPEVVRYGARGVPGLVALVGVKFTTARLAAEQAIDAVCLERGGAARRSATGLTALPHAGLDDVSREVATRLREIGRALDPEAQAGLATRYGTEATAVIDLSARHGLLERLVPESIVLAGEVAYAVERAGAIRLADAVQRRTTLGATGHPGHAALARAAAIMGTLRGWSAAERAAEIHQAEARYGVPGGDAPPASEPRRL